VIALSGGVGGAKLARGLERTLSSGELAVIANTGDDFYHYGLRICPDIDTLLYTLSGLASRERGWGREDETWTTMETLEVLGGETWFRLGDADLALHLERTQRLRRGDGLTQTTDDLGRRLGVTASVLPMSDDPVRTFVHTTSGVFAFQEYFVRHQCQPIVQRIVFEACDRARVSARVSVAFADPRLEVIVICPSNPYLSIDPILSVPGIRERIQQRRVPCIAVSPLIGGRAVKGPTGKIMAELGVAATNVAVANHYRGLIDGLVIDSQDAHDAAAIDVPAFAHPTLMTADDDKKRLAGFVLECVAKVRPTG
jgi:LPPG:FO 2-phospho-L-lactate transferase